MEKYLIIEKSLYINAEGDLVNDKSKARQFYYFEATFYIDMQNKWSDWAKSPRRTFEIVPIN